MSRELFIGMISGTSRDGADAALVRFNDNWPEVIEADCVPYSPDLAAELREVVATGRRPTPEEEVSLDQSLAAHFSRVAASLMEKAGVNPEQVAAIGSHGQTVWHDPDGDNPETIQLGNPESISRQTGIVTVGDFRRADMEAGGQGAPLAPLLHRALFSPVIHSGTGNGAVLNLGGIANISILGVSGSVSGFDTGPANCLMDAWIGSNLKQAFDRDGCWAASGQVSPRLLKSMLSDPFFSKDVPKSTGVEYFNSTWLERQLDGETLDAADVQATLAELTAVSVTDQLKRYSPEEVLVCGGGTHNSYLMQRLQANLPNIPLRSTAFRGLDPDWIEAILFAWLARERLDGRLQDTGAITGARKPVLLGKIFQPG
jgi:anhydro-N-acetylmuramic acid kinase